MILLIDVGNSRLKWAWQGASGLSGQQAVVHRDVEGARWAAPLFEAAHEVSRVLICNVAGAAMAKMLTDLSVTKFGIRPEFITASRHFQQLTNGYLDPGLLGADRWLTIIGAWTRIRSALCVIDAGTAVKVDAVDASGRHLGGLIVPGIHMMRDALLQGTSDIAGAHRLSKASSEGIFANNTIGAVSRGAELALAGLADHAADLIASGTGVEPKLLLTGGDAAQVAATMRRRGEFIPDLVLQGLAAVATEAPAAPARQGNS
jgi:type III pantothenate kinase